MSVLLEVHSTFATAEDAVNAGRTLVAERLAACAQVVPGLTSIFLWEDMLRHEAEALLVIKTLPELWPNLRDRLTELHSYETPQITALEIQHSSFEYLNWVKENLR